jgi:hypothetical protein
LRYCSGRFAANQETVDSGTSGDRLVKAGMSTALNLTSGAVQLVWGKALNNYTEPAFAIHGQLFVRLSGMAAVDTYVSKA